MSPGTEARNHCVEVLLALLARLQRSPEEDRWDLAEFCLDRCEEPIRRLAMTLKMTDHSNNERDCAIVERPATEDCTPRYVEHTSGPDLDFLLPLDSLDYHFDFDAFEGQWPFAI